MSEGVVADIAKHVKAFPDFPKKGILFRDFTPIFRQPALFQQLVDHIADHYRGKDIQAVAGLEARGFIFGPPVALALKVPFLTMRKAGKLPGETVGVDYGLEYGKDRMEIAVGAIEKGQRVAILDDLLATGGTAGAAADLVESQGGVVAEILCVIELKDLPGRANLEKRAPVHSLLQY